MFHKSQIEKFKEISLKTKTILIRAFHFIVQNCKS